MLNIFKKSIFLLIIFSNIKSTISPLILYFGAVEAIDNKYTSTSLGRVVTEEWIKQKISLEKSISSKYYFFDYGLMTSIPTCPYRHFYIDHQTSKFIYFNHIPPGFCGMGLVWSTDLKTVLLAIVEISRRVDFENLHHFLDSEAHTGILFTDVEGSLYENVSPLNQEGCLRLISKKLQRTTIQARRPTFFERLRGRSNRVGQSL